MSEQIVGRASPTLRLVDYLNGMRSATTAEELEAAVQAPYRHLFQGRTWATICKVRITEGQRICAAHPLGRYVPRFGAHRELTVCGQTYRVGRGQNSTGIRYCWHDAGVWAKEVLIRDGLSVRAANRIWDCCLDYPHRCLAVVEAAMAGQIPDPQLNVLIRHERSGYGSPINYTIEQNNADAYDHRATRPCICGGTLFDWGAGHDEGFEFINWHCNKCPDVFTEYMTREQLYALRNSIRHISPVGTERAEACK